MFDFGHEIVSLRLCYFFSLSFSLAPFLTSVIIQSEPLEQNVIGLFVCRVEWQKVTQIKINTFSLFHPLVGAFSVK